MVRLAVTEGEGLASALGDDVADKLVVVVASGVRAEFVTQMNPEPVTEQHPREMALNPPFTVEQWASDVGSPRKPNRLQQGNSCGGG